jgi:hypothetical protein
MALLITLLLALPAFAQPADCPAIPVGPPIDLDIFVGLNGPTKAPIAGALRLPQVPANGTICPPPPPPTGDVLRGAPAPHDLLRGDGTSDILRGLPENDVTVGPARPVPSRPDPARP